MKSCLGQVLVIGMSHNSKMLEDFLSLFSKKNGLASFSAMSLEGETWVKKSLKLEAVLSETNTDSYPEYFRESLQLRKNPLLIFPWAKSVFMFAIPFASLPDSHICMKRTDCDWKSGFVAGYALGKDYHRHAIEIINCFNSELKAMTGKDFKAESSIDTKPVSEKILAELSGLGKTGLNSCILCGNAGSGCFIASLFTDISIDCILTAEMIPETDCRQCGCCAKSCPGNVIGDNKNFEISRCISYLCGEKRAALSNDEIRALGNWIFGCGLCVTNCPGSKMPQPESIDLEWLLLSPSSQIKKAISGTALEHTGITQLRRNAVYVLMNKNDIRSEKLIRDFKNRQKSQFLEKIMGSLPVNP